MKQLFSLRATTINIESDASTTDVLASMDERQLINQAVAMSQGCVVIFGDGGEDLEPPTRPFLFAVNGKIYWMNLSPCECSGPTEE